MEKVLTKCIEHGLAVNHTKSAFHQNEVNFLQDIINGSNIHMESKTKIVKNWPIASRKKQMQFILEFANFYYNFIARYIEKVRALTRLTADIPFV